MLTTCQKTLYYFPEFNALIMSEIVRWPTCIQDLTEHEYPPGTKPEQIPLEETQKTLGNALKRVLSSNDSLDSNPDENDR